MNPGKRKIKIEIEDNDGDKYNLSLAGKLSKEKMLKVLELIGSFQEETVKTNETMHRYGHEDYYQQNAVNLGTKLWNIINSAFEYQKFSSSELSYVYNHTYNENIQLSIVSTYLSRFFVRNKLERIKHGKEWMYSINHNHNKGHDIHDITSCDSSITKIKSPITSKTPQDNLDSYEIIPTVYDLHQ